MSLFYQCIICQHANSSITDLHNHHTRYHNPEELSQTIINLKGFKIWNNMKPVKRKYLKSINLSGNNNYNNNNNNNNNNEDVYDHLFIKPELPNNSAYNSKGSINSPRKCGHDNTTCAINCRQFIAWECELNKREEINDEDFLDSIESLCYDLSKRKRRGRKKKIKPDMDTADKINLMQYVENVIGIKNTIVEQPYAEPYRMATTSIWNNEQSVANTIINDVLPIQIKKEVEEIENNETATLTSAKTDTDKNVVTHDLLCNSFSWSSIISMDIDERKIYAEEGNICSDSIGSNIGNFL